MEFMGQSEVRDQTFDFDVSFRNFARSGDSPMEAITLVYLPAAFLFHQFCPNFL